MEPDNTNTDKSGQLKKIGAFILVLLAAGWLSYSYFYRPKIQEINGYKMAIRNIELEMKPILGEDIILRKGDDKVKIKALEEELARLSEKIPTEKEVPYLIGNFVSEVGKELNVDYNLIEPQTIVDEGNYRRVPLKVDFTADLSSFYSYLSQLKNLPATVRVDGLFLKKTGTDKITVQLELSAFVMPGKEIKSRETAGVAPEFYKDIFALAAKPSAALATPQPATGPALELQGFWRGNKVKAFINNNIVGIGDSLDGYTLVSIAGSSAVLTKNGKSYTLTLEKQ
ncbi:MAG: type 4a pilus biogenesis protein PilO [Candidatus Margulisiibacteriota bacterium]